MLECSEVTKQEITLSVEHQKGASSTVWITQIDDKTLQRPQPVSRLWRQTG